MATTQGDILGWLKDGKRLGATHLLVICDTFSHEDYPVYVNPGQDPKKIAAEHDGRNMQRLMEVYAIHLDWKQQLGEFRSFHWEPAPAVVKVPKKAPPKKTSRAPKKTAPKKSTPKKAAKKKPRSR